MKLILDCRLLSGIITIVNYNNLTSVIKTAESSSYWFSLIFSFNPNLVNRVRLYSQFSTKSEVLRLMNELGEMPLRYKR